MNIQLLLDGHAAGTVCGVFSHAAEEAPQGGGGGSELPIGLREVDIQRLRNLDSGSTAINILLTLPKHNYVSRSEVHSTWGIKNKN